MATRSPVVDAELEEGVGGLADLALEVREGDRPRVAGLADPVVGDLVAQAALDVAVDAVVGDVELAAGEPLRERQVPLEGRVEGVDPIDRARGPGVAQNASKSASASAYRSAVALACATNSADGGNVRTSARRFSISGLDDEGRLDAHVGALSGVGLARVHSRRVILPRRLRWRRLGGYHPVRVRTQGPARTSMARRSPEWTWSSEAHRRSTR